MDADNEIEWEDGESEVGADDSGWSDDDDYCNADISQSPASHAPGLNEEQQRQLRCFQADLNDLPTGTLHQDDLDDWRTTLFFSVHELPEELCYAMALLESDTIEVTLCMPGGYRTAGAPIPRITIRNAGAAKHALFEAITRYLRSTWAKPGYEGYADGVTLDDAPKKLRFNLLAGLVRFVQRRIANITGFCPLCGEAHPGGTVALRILPCAKPICAFKYVEMGVACDPEFEVRTNPECVDLLLSAAYTACSSARRQDVLVPFPEAFVTVVRDHAQAVDSPVEERSFRPLATGSSPLDTLLLTQLEEQKQMEAHRDYDGLLAVLNSMPSVDTMRELLDKESGHTSKNTDHQPTTLRAILDIFDSRAFYVLRWVLSTNRCYVRAVDIDVIRNRLYPLQLPPNIRRAFQFLSLAPENQATGMLEKAPHNGRVSHDVFHGSAAENMHSILRNSLRVLSNTRLMTAGAAHGAALYFGKDYVTSLGYTHSRAPGAEWPNSRMSCERIQKRAVNAAPEKNAHLHAAAAGTDAAASSLPMANMLVCAIANTPGFVDQGWCFTHTDETSIATRYLLQL